MLIDVFKPLLTALTLPPASSMLLMLAGTLIFGRTRTLGRGLFWIGLISAWLLSCNLTAVFLANNLLTQSPPVSAAHLKKERVQAIVVLGGGMQRSSPEYGSPQLSAPSLVRVRYGAWLAGQTGLPLGFSGGVGWASMGTTATTEASGAAQVFKEFGQSVRWSEDQSRDTAESALRTRQLLKKDGIEKIALVTHSWHMPRSVSAFEEAGFTVVPAPTSFIQPNSRDVLEWLPSSEGILNSRSVIREWLGIQAGYLRKRLAS